MTQFIRATKNNLKPGNIVIKINEEGNPCGQMMMCSSFTQQIEQTEEVYCSIFKKDGFTKCKKYKLSQLARVIDHKLKRKLKPEEEWNN